MRREQRSGRVVPVVKIVVVLVTMAVAAAIVFIGLQRTETIIGASNGPTPEYPARPVTTTYALGWFCQDYRGERLIISCVNLLKSGEID